MDRSKTVAKLGFQAGALAEKVRDAKLDDRAADLAAAARERQARLEERAAELAAMAREKLREADLESKAAVAVAGAGAAAAQAADAAREATDRTLGWVGERLSDTAAGDRLADTAVGTRLGLTKPSRRRSWWVLVLVGVAAAVGFGYVSRKRRDEEAFDWEVGEPIGQANDAEPSFAPPAPTDAVAGAVPLEGRVREALGQDPRTAALPRLNVNVVEGTVFVRGSVNGDVDQDALRAVIESVEGVSDVDLQVTVGS